jgi:membrane protease YdiL (CAAX protease family)
MSRALEFAALLVAWGNLTGAVFGTGLQLPGGTWSYVIAGIALVLVSLACARWMSMGAADIGLRGDHLRGALAGALLAVVAALIGAGLLRGVAPLLLGGAVEYAPLTTVTGVALAQHVAFFLPLGDVLPEEIAFRGVLVGALLRAERSSTAVLVAGAVFALWHLAVLYTTLDLTSLAWPSTWFIPAFVGALLVLFGGGALFAWLRVRTSSLATTIAAHWLFNAVLLWALWGTRPLPPSGCC